MFRKQPDAILDTVTVEVEGKPVRVGRNESAAAAAIIAGLDFTRTSPVTGEPWATSESGPLVRASGSPARSVSPAEAPQVSTSTGRWTLPASSTAARLA